MGLVVKISAGLLATAALLQLAGCGGTSSSSAHNTSSDDAEALDGDAIDDAAPDDDADASDAGALEADAPAANVSRVPLLHRATADACLQPRPAGGQVAGCSSFHGDAGVALGPGECLSDQDCTAGSNGRCTCGPGPVLAARCSYDNCASDSDCSGGVCDCRESAAHVTWGTQTVCLAGNCRTDTDCGAGGYCSPSPVAGCGAQGWYAYFCHTRGDQCVNDSDCNEANAYCAYDTSASTWVCSTGMCVDG
jgi:hypothetical protein